MANLVIILRCLKYTVAANHYACVKLDKVGATDTTQLNKQNIIEIGSFSFLESRYIPQNNPQISLKGFHLSQKWQLKSG